MCRRKSDLFVAAAECGDAPKKKGFFKGFWKRSRHYSLENQQPRLGGRVTSQQRQRQAPRQQHHYRQHVATSALTHSACCCIVQQPRSRFVVEPATRFAFLRPFHRAFIPADRWPPTQATYVNPWVNLFPYFTFSTPLFRFYFSLLHMLSLFLYYSSVIASLRFVSFRVCSFLMYVFYYVTLCRLIRYRIAI